jgi:tRNA nucleotidyltransferase/poly(A) polymerase
MTLQVVADILRRRQSPGWLVGGSVRDRELGCFSPDFDIVVSDDAEAVTRELARQLKAPWFVLSERHPAYRVMGCEGRIDVAPVKGGGILDDLAERDFTVNAMAVPIGGTEIIDPFGGRGHLRERRLVTVSERVFREDPLRMMRAARFRHVLGLEIDADLAGTMREQAPLLAGTAVERTIAEAALTLAAGRAGEAVRLWRDVGLLGEFLPEVLAEDRLGPALAVLDNLDDILEGPAQWFPLAAWALAARLAQPLDGALARPVALRLAALVRRLSPDEAVRAARRLKLSDDMVSLFSATTRRATAGSLPRVPRGREAVLFLWETAPWEPEVILVEAANEPALLELLNGLLLFWEERATTGGPRLPVDGKVLMDELRLVSGPLLGSVLREARLAWEAGEAADRQQVLNVARAALARATSSVGA